MTHKKNDSSGNSNINQTNLEQTSNSISVPTDKKEAASDNAAIANALEKSANDEAAKLFEKKLELESENTKPRENDEAVKETTAESSSENLCDDKANDIESITISAQEDTSPKIEMSLSIDDSTIKQAESTINTNLSNIEKSPDDNKNLTQSSASTKTDNSLIPEESQDTVVKNNPDSKPKKKIFAESSLAETIPAVAVIVSLIALVLTTITAISYSHYYNIPLRELANITTAIEYVADVLPVLLILFMIVFPIKYIEMSINSPTRGAMERIGEIVIIFGFTVINSIAISFYFVNCISIFLPIAENESFFSFVMWLTMTIIILVFSYVTYGYACKEKKTNPGKRSNAANYYMVSIAILYLLLVFLTAVGYNSVKIINPKSIKEYETVTYNDEQYVVICNSSNGKIIMRYSVTDDKTLVIDNSQYDYLQLENHETTFEYHHYNSVITLTESKNNTEQ